MDTSVVRAEISGDHVEADMVIMDDHGNILSHYTRESFSIRDGYFFYNEPPAIEGMVFDTANILELVTEKGPRFRASYFYSSEGMEDQPLPEPFPTAEMPKKGADIEERTVWVSWTDEKRRELSESVELTYDFYWDAYEIPEPKELTGYGYQKIQTGSYLLSGSEVPHFVFEYKKGSTNQAAPSLLFGHLLEVGRIRTIKAESVLPEPPKEEPGPEPADPGESTDPEPGMEPDTSPDIPVTGTVPHPATTPEAIPGRDEDSQQEPGRDPPSSPDPEPGKKPVLTKPPTTRDTKPAFTQPPVPPDKSKPDEWQEEIPSTGSSSGQGKTNAGNDTEGPGASDDARDTSGGSGAMILTGLVFTGASLLLLRVLKKKK